MAKPEAIELLIEFYQEFHRVTDLRVFIRFLARSGVGLLTEACKDASDEEVDLCFRVFIGQAVSDILENRKERGLSNDPDSIFGNPHDLAPFVTEFIVDSQTKLRVAVGLVQGLKLQGLLKIEEDN